MIITDKKFSDIIQSFIATEINAILAKYNSIESDTLEKVENLISQIDDEELKKEFL